MATDTAAYGLARKEANTRRRSVSASRLPSAIKMILWATISHAPSDLSASPRSEHAAWKAVFIISMASGSNDLSSRNVRMGIDAPRSKGARRDRRRIVHSAPSGNLGAIKIA